MNKFLQDPTNTRTIYYSKQKFNLKHQGIFDVNCKKKKGRKAQENIFKPDKTTQSSDDEGNTFFGSSTNLILSHRRITYDKQQFLNTDEVSILYENEQLAEKFPTFKILQCKQQILPQIPSPANISQMRLSTRQQIVKPLLKKQKTLDYISQMQFQSREYTQLQEGADLKCLFKSQMQLEDNYDKILILNFNNILFKKPCSYWEQKNQITHCSFGLVGNQFESCDNSFCICNLRKDSKQSLKILSRHYIIVLITNNQYFANIWHKYFQDSGFNYDAMYKLNFSKFKSYGGIKLNKILDDFQRYKIQKLLYIDSVEQVSNSQIYPELFQYKLPIIQENIEVAIFLIKQFCSKLFDFQFFLNVCMSYQNGKESILSKRQVIFENINLSDIFDYFIKEEVQQKQRLKELKGKKTDFKNNFMLNQKQLDKSFDASQKEEILIEWTTETRNDFLDDFKHKRTERVPQLFFQIGDLIVRNQKFKLAQMIQQSKNLKKLQKSCTTSKKREKEKFIKQDSKIKVNCFFVQD